MTRTLLTCLACAWLLVPSPATGATIRQVFEHLASDDAAKRFQAAVVLVYSRAPKLDALLAQETAKGFFSASPETAAAAEFVRLRRSGENLAPQSLAQGSGPNVFLISIDTLRADHLSCYGYERQTSPTIDALAARGALFLNAISPSSWTLPAHMSIFTSLYPSFHKLEHGGKLGSVRLDPSERTLTEILKAAGYTTAGFVAHPFLSGEWGFDRGFDIYKRYSTRANLQADRVELWLDWHRFHVARGLSSPNFFLFLHFLDPHETYSAPSPYREKYFPDYAGPLKPTDKLVTLYSEKDFETPEDYRYALALYDGEINFVDDNLARIFDKLRENGWQDSTFVILTSDHGEEFKDHGSMGHKSTLYREQLEVPLILAHPQKIKPGQSIETEVSTLDILPTVLEMAGLKFPETVQGRSLMPHMKMKTVSASTKTDAGRQLFAELGPLGYEWEGATYRKALRNERHKLIYSYRPDGAIEKELYDVRTDPAEKRNLYEGQKAQAEVRALEAVLGDFVREGSAYNPEFRQQNEIEIDAETQERLRALGYIE